MAKAPFGPETIHAVMKMLSMRPELRNDDPLFVKLHGKGAGSRQMDKDAISAIFRRLAWKAGLADVSAHSLRKFNTTYLSVPRMPELWLGILQGKAIPGTWGPYVQPTDQQLLDAYRQAYPKLAVLTSEPIDEEARAEVERLRRKVDDQEKQLNELERGNERARKLDILLEDPDVYQAFVETLQRLKERKKQSQVDPAVGLCYLADELFSVSTCLLLVL